MGVPSLPTNGLPRFAINHFLQMKFTYKKVFALYLPVAFFFVVFSFGKVAHATTLYSQTIDTNDESGSPGPYYPGTFTNSSWPDASQTVTDIYVTISNSAGSVFMDLQGCSTAGGGSASKIVSLGSPGAVKTLVHVSGLSDNVNWNTCTTQYFYTSSGTLHVYGASVGNPYFVLTDSGGITPPDYSTRFSSFVVDASSHSVTATGYWTASATSSESQELRFYQVSPTLGQESYVSLVATTTGNFHFTFPYLDTSFQISATSSSYSLGPSTSFHGEIYQLYSGFNPFSNTGTPPILLTSTSTSVQATTTATVVSNNPRSLSGLPEPADCSLGAITGCIKNAGVWLFYPSSDAIDSFKSLGTTLSGKFPFAYAYGINTLRQELFGAVATSSQTISLSFKLIPGHGTSTLELLSQSKLSAVPFAGLIKQILGWLLWLLGVEYIYYRVIRSHDSQTPS